MDIVARAKGMILTPAEEWSTVAAEPTDTGTLFTSYVMPLAAIPAVAGFLSMLFLGVGIARALIFTVVSYILSLVSVFVMGKIAEMLAPNFGGQGDAISGLKLAAYAPTAAWVAGIATIVPVIGWIVALIGAIYSLYVYYLGGPIVMRVPQDKALVFTIVIIVAAIALHLLVGFFAAMFLRF